MTDLGVFANVMNAQNVTLKVDSSDDVISLFNIRLSDQSVLDRRNARDGAIDTPSFALLEITADAVVDKALYEHFQTQRILTDRGALPSEAFSITAAAISTSSFDSTVSGTYTLRGLDVVAAERGRYECTLTMRINGALTVA